LKKKNEKGKIIGGNLLLLVYGCLLELNDVKADGRLELKSLAAATFPVIGKKIAINDLRARKAVRGAERRRKI